MSAERETPQHSALSPQHFAFAAVAAPLAVLLTPFGDRDLAIVAVLVVALAWLARESPFAAAIECAVPLMVLACAFVEDERLRMMVVGVVVCGAAGFSPPSTFGGLKPSTFGGLKPAAPLVIIGIVLFRWLPTSDLELLRELIVLAGALAVLAALRERSPLAVLAVLAVAAVTPIHPGRAMLFPFVVALLLLVPGRLVVGLVLLAAIPFARPSVASLFVCAALALLLPLVARVRPLAYAAALALFAMWPWSGVVARGLPLAWRFDPPAGRLRAINASLGSAESAKVDLPPRVRRVVVTASGENIPRLRAGKPLGSIVAKARDGRVCTRELRVGDVADFGFLRREQFFSSRNPLPRRTPFDVYGSGATSFVKGNGRVAVACGGADLASLAFAAAGLPKGARLQIESIELPAR
jgi:hypothetical protein